MLSVVDIRAAAEVARAQARCSSSTTPSPAVSPAAAQAGHQRRRPLDDQVPRRSLGRRSAASSAQGPGGRGAARLQPERSAQSGPSTRGSPSGGSRRSRPGSERHCANAAHGRRGLLGHPAVGGHVPGSAGPSRARACGAPDARLRRDGLVHRRLPGGKRRLASAREAVQARREPRRRRVPDRAPGADNARSTAGRPARGAAHASSASRSGWSGPRICSPTSSRPSPARPASRSPRPGPNRRLVSTTKEPVPGAERVSNSKKRSKPITRAWSKPKGRCLAPEGSG